VSGGASRAIGRVFLVTGHAAIGWSGYVWTRADFERTARADELPVVAEVGVRKRAHPGLLNCAAGAHGNRGQATTRGLRWPPDTCETPQRWDPGVAPRRTQDADFRPYGNREEDVIGSTRLIRHGIREGDVDRQPTDVSVLKRRAPR
jgi:hypothetical protein